MRPEKSALQPSPAFWILLLIAATLSSCGLFGWPGEPDKDQPSELGGGVMLMRHGSWLYRVGGSTDPSSSSASVRMAGVDESGASAAWLETASLPMGIRYGAAFSAGNLAYVIGGRNGGEPVSTIYYSGIDSDGSIGFGTDDHWETNARPLPEPRAAAAWVLNDGWIYLLGGMTPSGTTDSIIRARIYQDGQVGQWYESAQTLPSARWGAAAVAMGGRLYVAGGADAHGLASELASFAMGEYGTLSDRRIEADLPEALQEAFLLCDGEDLILAGGYGDGKWSEKVYRYHEGMWTDTLCTVIADASFFGSAGGDLLYLPRSNVEDAGTARLHGLYLAPAAPIVVPGSGMVPNNSLIHVDGEPGVTLRYREDGGAPLVTDPVWPEASIKISPALLPSMELSIAAFAADGTVSPAARPASRVRAGGLFVVIEDTLPIHDVGYSALDYRVMQTRGSAGAAPTAASSLWYRVRIDAAGNYRLSWADSDEDAAFSARLMLSVYETDLCTEALDVTEIPALERRGEQSNPLHLALNPGEYFIFLHDIDDWAGGDFGLSLVRE